MVGERCKLLILIQCLIRSAINAVYLDSMAVLGIEGEGKEFED